MGGLNTDIFNTRTGQVKIVSIVLGLVALILTADHWNGSSKAEEVFWWSIVVCFAISVILAGLSLIGMMENSNMAQLDKIFHALAAILLIVTACFFIVQVDKWKKADTHYERRAAAGGFGLIYGVVCAYIGYSLL